MLSGVKEVFEYILSVVVEQIYFKIEGYVKTRGYQFWIQKLDTSSMPYDVRCQDVLIKYQVNILQKDGKWLLIKKIEAL